MVEAIPVEPKAEASGYLKAKSIPIKSYFTLSHLYYGPKKQAFCFNVLRVINSLMLPPQIDRVMTVESVSCVFNILETKE